MKLKITIIALLISASTSLQAQTSSEKYQTKQGMTSEMQVIVRGLELEGVQIQQLGQMMESQRQHKEDLLKEIDRIKEQLKQVDAVTEKKLQGMLTPSEWKKYLSEIKPQLKKMQETRLKRLDD